ncbi:MAG: hypothetical protein LBJ93_03385 [Clostridiales bacterium]|nr:hypothetical protein [Clostridiales bacterium]
MFLHGFPEYLYLFTDHSQLYLFRICFGQLAQKEVFNVTQGDLFLVVLNFFEEYSFETRPEVFYLTSGFMEYFHNSSLTKSSRALTEFMINQYIVDREDKKGNLRYGYFEELIHTLVILGVIQESCEEDVRQEIATCRRSIFETNNFFLLTRVDEYLFHRDEIHVMHIQFNFFLVT